MCVCLKTSLFLLSWSSAAYIATRHDWIKHSTIRRKNKATTRKRKTPNLRKLRMLHIEPRDICGMCVCVCYVCGFFLNIATTMRCIGLNVMDVNWIHIYIYIYILHILFHFRLTIRVPRTYIYCVVRRWSAINSSSELSWLCDEAKRAWSLKISGRIRGWCLCLWRRTKSDNQIVM